MNPVRTLRYLSVVFAVALLLAPALPADEVRYLKPRPLTALAGDAAQPVAAGGALQVPVLARGADLVVVQALEGGAFERLGLEVELTRGDDFPAQVKAALAGSSPLLRGTVTMIQNAAEVFAAAGLELVVIHHLGWSAGGDALVARGDVAEAAQLAGKTIGLQRHGPHLAFLHRLLDDAGLSLSDVELRWLAEPTLPPRDAGAIVDPASAMLADPQLDAVLVTLPDALALTSGGTAGSGAAGSVRGARILASTAAAPRSIAEVYAVRSDYLAAAGEQLERFVEALAAAGEQLAAAGGPDRRLLERAGEVLFGSSHARAEVRALWSGFEPADRAANRTFFTTASGLA
ncbi:MAG: hypothetical protein D6696_19880, partial [Acidobacteria bacterium]